MKIFTNHDLGVELTIDGSDLSVKTLRPSNESRLLKDAMIANWVDEMVSQEPEP